MKHGYYYVPSDCSNPDTKCQLQMVLHGGGMDAQTFAPIFAPYAAANNVILLVPQANGSWENNGTIGSTPEEDE